MAVPTRDARGRLTGVLAAAVLPQPLAIARGSLDLGDRASRSSTARAARCSAGFRRPAQRRARAHAERTGVVAETRGLDGSRGHALAYTTSTIPGLDDRDRPAALVLFADARRGVLPRARARRRRHCDRAVPDRAGPAARAARGRAGAHALAAARTSSRASSAAPLWAATSRTASWPGSPMPSPARSASSRWSPRGPRPGALGLGRRRLPVDRGRPRHRRRAGGDARLRLRHPPS